MIKRLKVRGHLKICRVMDVNLRNGRVNMSATKHPKMKGKGVINMTSERERGYQYNQTCIGVLTF